MKRILHFSLIIILFLVPCVAQKSKPLTNSDKSQIIKAVLLDTDFINRRLARDEQKETIYLSTENLPAAFAPEIRGINFTFISPRQIKGKANTLFRYYVFQELKEDGSKIAVSFSRVTQDSRIPCPSCTGSASSVNGIRYEFRKIEGKWKAKKLNGYASGS